MGWHVETKGTKIHDIGNYFARGRKTFVLYAYGVLLNFLSMCGHSL